MSRASCGSITLGGDTGSRSPKTDPDIGGGVSIQSCDIDANGTLSVSYELSGTAPTNEIRSTLISDRDGELTSKNRGTTRVLNQLTGLSIDTPTEPLSAGTHRISLRVAIADEGSVGPSDERVCGEVAVAPEIRGDCQQLQTEYGPALRQVAQYGTPGIIDQESVTAAVTLQARGDFTVEQLAAVEAAFDQRCRIGSGGSGGGDGTNGGEAGGESGGSGAGLLLAGAAALAVGYAATR